MVTFSNTQQLTSAQDWQGSRAVPGCACWLGLGVAQVAADFMRCRAALQPEYPVLRRLWKVFRLRCFVRLPDTPDSGGTVAIFKVEARATSGTAVTPNYVERSLSSYLEK